MVPQSDRTRPSTKADARQYLAKADEFLAAMESQLAAQQWDAAGLAAIHSGISTADAVLSYRGGVRSAGQDHRASAELLVQVLGSNAEDGSKHLRRLIQKKTLVEYEQRRLTQAEATDLAEHARRLLKWAQTQVPS
ncbi:MAG: hypothetical protein Q7W51_01640 [Coriobacteriia bacterium]|nr:hypothetical protein [Coriobacteriia bacterium]